MKRTLLVLIAFLVPMLLAAQTTDSCGTIMRTLGGIAPWVPGWTSLAYANPSTRSVTARGGQVLSLRKHPSISVDTVIVERQVFTPAAYKTKVDTVWLPAVLLDLRSATVDSTGVVILNTADRQVQLYDPVTSVIRVRTRDLQSRAIYLQVR